MPFPKYFIFAEHFHLIEEYAMQL